MLAQAATGLFAAVLFYLLFKRQKLIARMITGAKDDPNDTLEPIPGSRVMIATGTLIVVAAAVWLTVTFL